MKFKDSQGIMIIYTYKTIISWYFLEHLQTIKVHLSAELQKKPKTTSVIIAKISTMDLSDISIGRYKIHQYTV